MLVHTGLQKASEKVTMKYRLVNSHRVFSKPSYLLENNKVAVSNKKVLLFEDDIKLKIYFEI